MILPLPPAADRLVLRNGNATFPESRCVQPEILDGLAQDSPAARASRRDLHQINRLMDNAAWFGRVLCERRRAFEEILELGAGTGELGRALGARGLEPAGLDLCNRPSGWPPAMRWFQTDVLAFTAWAGFPVVIGNLFFHHFNREQLADIGVQLGLHARLIVASEPVRRQRTQWLFSLACRLIRAHPVTRHDGRVSIAAGFSGDELPRLLLLDPALWTWRVRETWRGASRLVAERRP